MTTYDELVKRLRHGNRKVRDISDEAADAIESLQRDNAALMEDSAAQVRIARDAVERAAGLRQVIATVCEGWTLPVDVRKILETALWSQADIAKDKA
ncbi:hypothetical protein [Paraburkholderia tropica]|uniref:hypothetical protein n=1 Tax=Paraburkholderia tropica TaxID=92647 RepID=UPI0007EC3AA9|nr:hypothetical protein [Paraburkholderia tropica]OBR54136.1 hypothetical protein A6456_37715 [Paraburkholderia tropica]